LVLDFLVPPAACAASAAHGTCTRVTGLKGQNRCFWTSAAKVAPARFERASRGSGPRRIDHGYPTGLLCYPRCSAIGRRGAWRHPLCVRGATSNHMPLGRRGRLALALRPYGSRRVEATEFESANSGSSGPRSAQAVPRFRFSASLGGDERGGIRTPIQLLARKPLYCWSYALVCRRCAVADLLRQVCCSVLASPDCRTRTDEDADLQSAAMATMRSLVVDLGDMRFPRISRGFGDRRVGC
jgi:hypothetical protein